MHIPMRSEEKSRLTTVRPGRYLDLDMAFDDATFVSVYGKGAPKGTVDIGLGCITVSEIELPNIYVHLV
jgi:hypothetical protein